MAMPTGNLTWRLLTSLVAGPPANGDPVSTWPDNGGLYDATSSGSNRPVYRPNGKGSVPALQFDGTDDRFILPNNIALDYSNTNGWTICGVVKPTVAGFRWIISRPSGSWVGFNGVRFLTWTRQPGDDKVSTGVIADGNWHSFVVTGKSGTLKMYVDGVEVFNAAYTLTHTTGQQYIGMLTTGSEPFSGMMIELAQYDRDFSTTDVSDHHAEMVALYGTLPTSDLRVATAGVQVVLDEDVDSKVRVSTGGAQVALDEDLDSFIRVTHFFVDVLATDTFVASGGNDPDSPDGVGPTPVVGGGGFGGSGSAGDVKGKGKKNKSVVGSINGIRSMDAINLSPSDTARLPVAVLGFVPNATGKMRVLTAQNEEVIIDVTEGRSYDLSIVRWYSTGTTGVTSIAVYAAHRQAY